MTPKDINIELAKLDGWTFKPGPKYIGGESIIFTNPQGKSANGWVGKSYRSNDSASGWDSNDGVYFSLDSILEHPNHVVGPIPNYYKDLNALHELEKKIVKDKWAYRLVFQDVKGLRGNNHEYHFLASAPQRCEALLRYKKVWKE